MSPRRPPMSLPLFTSSVPALVAMLALADAGRAQVVNLSGNVFDGAGGPLLSGVVYHAVGHLTVPAGTTLTVAPGAIVKFGQLLELDVHGTLLVNGTAASPAIFTSIQDDTAGGDTNGNGPSVGMPNDYRGLLFHATSDASVLTRAIVRFAGAFGLPGILLTQTDLSLQSCVVASCGFDGVRLQGGSLPSISGCAFDDNGTVAVQSVSLDAVPGFLANTAAGNAGGNCMRVTTGTLAASRTIAPQNVLNGALVLATDVSVPAGTTLTLQAGVVLKMASSGLVFDVDGNLLTTGTAAAPVVITSLADDAWGGDTNANGPSSGAPLDWRGMRLKPTSGGSLLDHLVVRYAGNFGWAGMQLQANVVMRDCAIESCAFAGLQLTNARPAVRACAFVGNGGTAVIGASLDAVGGFVYNTASGNGTGDYLDVGDPNVPNSCTIDRSNLINGALVLSTQLTIPAGVTTTFEQGVVVKARYTNGNVYVAGGLDVRGTGYDPVVFTSYADDAHGGDTNGNGPSTGAPGDWIGINLPGTASASRIEHALLRFGGGSGAPMFQSHSPQATIRSMRAEFSGLTGIYLTNHATNFVPNLVAFENAGVGILLGGGTFEVHYATSVRNGGFGFQRFPAFQGIVGNSISWSNAANFGGFSLGQAVNCNGDPNFGMFQIPGFRNEAAGDLQLTHNCAMVDQGDLNWAYQIEKDHLENSRILDDDLNSVAVPDLGAYELSWWDMAVSGQPRVGATLTITLPPHLPFTGIAIYAFGVLDGVIYTQPSGFVLLGTTPILLGWSAIGAAFPFDIPNDPGIVGFRAGLQSLAWPLGPAVHTTLTRLYRMTILP